MTQQFLIPIPAKFTEDPELLEWAIYVHNFLDDLTRQDGSIDTIDTTEETVLTQGEKLDLMTVTAAVNIDTLDTDTSSNKSSLAALKNSLPAFTLSNNTTDRTYDSNAAAGAITSPPSQAEVENIREAVLELADVLATTIQDLIDKNVFGT